MESEKSKSSYLLKVKFKTYVPSFQDPRTLQFSPRQIDCEEFRLISAFSYSEAEKYMEELVKNRANPDTIEITNLTVEL
jgi:hypothetical protein